MAATMSVNLRLPNGRFPAGSFNFALRQARIWLEQDVARAFGNKIDPITGRSWPPAKKPRNPLLERTRALRAAALAATAQATINGNTLIVLVPTPMYGRYHVSGTRRMPKRNFLGASPSTLRKLLSKAGKDSLTATTRSRSR